MHSGRVDGYISLTIQGQTQKLVPLLLSNFSANYAIIQHSIYINEKKFTINKFHKNYNIIHTK
jgi:hypothetical protein